MLNDNDMSIAKPVGAMSKYLLNFYQVNYILVLEKQSKWLFQLFQKDLVKKLVKQRTLLRGIVTGGTLFSELGFYYIGPVDGHDVDNLVQIFENVKNSIIKDQF